MIVDVSEQRVYVYQWEQEMLALYDRMGECGEEELDKLTEEAGELQERVEFQQLVDNSYAEKAVNS